MVNEIVDKFNNFIELFPHYGYLIAGIGFSLLFFDYI